jgi:hypothetical protein
MQKKKTFIIFGLILFLVSANLHAKILRVPQDFSTIQKGIDASFNGDTILVSPGIYYENVNFGGKEVVLTSNFIFSSDSLTISQTIIDGGKPKFSDSASVISCISTENTVIQGFTLQNGKGTFCNKYWRGGGIFSLNSSLKILNNCIKNNSCQWGGGIYAELSSVLIQENEITHNVSAEEGGGIFFFSDFDSFVLRNFIGHNQGLAGGGIFLITASPSIKENHISQNVSTSASIGGGGILCFFNAAPEIERNLFVENYTPGWGGGILCDYISPALITNNTFDKNSGLKGGGGIGCWQSDPIITNNIICNSSFHQAVWASSFSSPLVHFNNFWEETPLRLNPFLGDTTCCFNRNNTPSDSLFNIYRDPLFVEPGKNYSLNPNSPCIDAGDISLPPPVEGGCVIDMGAYEFKANYVCGDVNADEICDIGDIITLINFVFYSGPAPYSSKAGDVNNDGEINLGDIVCMVSHVFQEEKIPCTIK